MSPDTFVSTADEAFCDLPLRVGFRTSDLSDERLRYIKQLGVEDVFVDSLRGEPDDPPGLVLREDRPPTAGELVQARNRVEDAGIRFAGIQTLREPFYEPIAFGEDDAGERIEYLETLIRNAGRAKIPIVGYRWSHVHRTSFTRRVRGGAKATAYDHDDFADAGVAPDGRDVFEEEFWENYVRFLEEVVPVAEEAGVTLAIHPADPPGFERLDGLPRLFRNVDDFGRAMEAVPSDHHGLKLCLGCFSEMGEDVEEVVARFGDRIAFVHFRDIVGTVPSFHETFVDEGNYDEYAVTKRLHDVGFSGVLIPDHVPRMEGDEGWAPRGRGYTAGYLKGLVKAVRSEAQG